MRDLRLIIWDVDGTLTNSRAAILSAMQGAFAQCNLPYPGDAAALEGVGLSLDILLERLVPDTGVETREALARAYKQTYYDQRARQGAAMQRESELYAPIKALLTGQGYEVKGEVGAADLVAVRSDEQVVIVELKLRLTLSLFHQACARLKLTDHVYIGVPKPCGRTARRALKDNLALCRRLGLGYSLFRLR